MRDRRTGWQRTAVLALAGLIVAASVAVVAPGAAWASRVVSTCQSAPGYVYDIYGRALQGAFVDATGPANNCGGAGAQATTDATGFYQVWVEPSTNGTPATVSLAGYATQAHAILASVSSGGAAVVPSQNLFTLPYALNASLSKAWVQPGATVSVTATTLAPPPTTSGYVCAAGANDYNELGDGKAESQRAAPGAVEGVGGTGSLGSVKAVAAGDIHALALRADASVVAWGDNADGELGNGSTAASAAPVAVAGVGGSGTLSGVSALAAAGYTDQAGSSYGFSLALLSGGSVVAWGENAAGELGNGTTANSSTPVPVAGVGGSGTLGGVTAIAASWEHAYALLTNGTVVAWGDNAAGNLGDGTLTPSAVPVAVEGVGGAGTLSGVVAIAAGSANGYALRSDGSVVAWGDNLYDELGNGSTSPTHTTAPVVVAGVGATGSLGNVSAISAGESHALALRSDGSVLAWGYNVNGQLGDGTVTSRDAPVAVAGPGGSGTLGGVRGVSAGLLHSLALRDDGTVLSWGDNSASELANTTLVQSDTPTSVEGANGSGVLNDVTGAGAGGLFSLFLRANPCAAAALTTMTEGELPGGAILGLTQGATNSAGYTTWTGSYTVPANASQGVSNLEACVVDQAVSLDCDKAAGEAAPYAVSPVALLPLGVDDTPPSVVMTTPGAFADIAGTASVSVTWTDSLSGVNPSSFAMTIDGAPVGVVANGSPVYMMEIAYPALAPGPHYVTASAADVAGNKASTSFLFAVAPPSASTATATLDPSSTLTVPVNPNNSLPPPSSVTFAGAALDAGAWQLSLAASVEPGLGTFERAIDLSGAEVTFSNGVTTSAPEPAGATATQSARVAGLGTAAGTVATGIAAARVAIPAFSVAVPTGYNTPGSTATLTLPGPANLGAVTAADSNAELDGGFCTGMPCSLPVALVTAECVTQVAVCSPTGQTTDAEVNIPGVGWVNVLHPQVSAAEADTGYAKVDPGCDPPGGGTCGQQVPSGLTAYPCPPAETSGATQVEVPLKGSACGQSDIGSIHIDGSANQADTAASGVALGCEDANLGSVIDLCTGAVDPNGQSAHPYLALYQNLFVYSVRGCTAALVTNALGESEYTCNPPADPTQFLAFEQDHAAPATATGGRGASDPSSLGAAPCPEATSGTVTSALDNLDANLASDGTQGSAYTPGLSATAAQLTDGIGATTTTEQAWEAELGTTNTPTSAAGAGSTKATYEIAHMLNPVYGPPASSAFSSAKDAWTDAQGNPHANDGADPATGTTYQAASTATSAFSPPQGMTSLAQDVEMFWGAEFDANPATPSNPVLDGVATAMFTLTYSCT